VTELELYYDGSTAVRHFDGAGLVPTSATVTLRDSAGATVSSPTVTVPSLSTTVTAATTTALTLASVTGLSVGKHLAVVSDGVTYVVEVSRLDGSVVHLTSALPLVVATGATAKLLDMTATIAAPGSAKLGSGLRLEWVYSDGTTTLRQGIPCAVVRGPWQPIVSAADVRQHMADVYQDSRRSDSWCERIAARANEQIKGALAAVQRRPYLYASEQKFREAALRAMRYELAIDSICLGGQVFEAQRESRFAMSDELSRVLTSLAEYDADNTGKTDTNPRPLGMSVQASR
jgi:hypothetical protein